MTADRPTWGAEGAVSAIIPTRNRPSMLRRAIKSVLDQRGDHVFEVIVVFDQEEPDLHLYAEFPDAPLRLTVNNHTPGLAGARNSGIDAAMGEWVAFCDDDDAWSRDKLQRQLALANRLPNVDFVVAGIEIRRGNRSFVRVPNRAWITFPDLLRSRIMEAHPSTFLVRRAAIDDFGGLDEKLPGSYAEDYDWLIRAARVKDIAVVDVPLAMVQWHTESYFTNRWPTINDALAHLVAKTPEFALDPAGLARIEGQRGFALAAMGERDEAMELTRRAWSHSKRELRPYLTMLVAFRLVKADTLVRLANSVGRGV